MSKDIYNPNHYLNEAGQDLFEEWYMRYPFETFRVVMWCTAERYYRRYYRKNGLEDLNKGMRVMDRLKEYEERYSNEKLEYNDEYVRKVLEEAVLNGVPEKGDTDGNVEIFRTNYLKETDVLEAVYKGLQDAVTEDSYFDSHVVLEELKTAIFDRLDALEKAYSTLHWYDDVEEMD